MNDLIIDIRERLVRIETKQDAQAEADRQRQTREDQLDERVTGLESEAQALKASIRTVKYVGGGLVTLMGLFGSKLAHLF